MLTPHSSPFLDVVTVATHLPILAFVVVVCVMACCHAHARLRDDSHS